MGFSLWNWKDRFWEDEVFSRKLKHNRFKIFCDSSSTWNTGAAESLWIGKVKKPCLVANNPIMPPSSKKSGFNEIAKGTDVILRTQFSPWTWSPVYRKTRLDFFNCIQSCFSLSQKSMNEMIQPLKNCSVATVQTGPPPPPLFGPNRKFYSYLSIYLPLILFLYNFNLTVLL